MTDNFEVVSAEVVHGRQEIYNVIGVVVLGLALFFCGFFLGETGGLRQTDGNTIRELRESNRQLTDFYGKASKVLQFAVKADSSGKIVAFANKIGLK